MSLDFSENFSFVVQDAAQGFHWNCAQATIHPWVYYYKNDNELKHGSFTVISECNTNDVRNCKEAVKKTLRREPNKSSPYENTAQKSRCIIRIYDFYASKRPADYPGPDNAFYSVDNTKFKMSFQAKEQTWFTRGPVGKNKTQHNDTENGNSLQFNRENH